jgi:glycosyltransferase involved in cell wall biosynthesis
MGGIAMSAGASTIAAKISAAAQVAKDASVRQMAPNRGCADTRRLIFINRYFFPDLSATSQMLSDLVRSLSADGFELHVICSRQLYHDPRSRLRSREFAAEANVHRCWSTRFGRSGLAGRSLDYATFLLTALLRLSRLSRRGDIVVALTDPPMISVMAAAVARMRGALLINWLQDVFPEIALALGVVRLPAWGTALLLRLRNWTLRVACRNVVLGASMGRLIRTRGVPSSAVRIIENWADADGLLPRPLQRSSLRRSLCADRRFVIQYSGNLGRAHEYETLLGAALELRTEEHWLFLFVGDGANMRLLRSKAERAGLQNMRFLPLQPRENLADCLAAADVHVACLLPTLEGLIVPSKLYGILAVGRPVIVIGDPDGEQARVVRGARCGSVIRCGDSAGLVDELRRMRSEAEWLQEAGINARQLFERRYTLAAAAGKWRRMLADLGLNPYEG